MPSETGQNGTERCAETHAALGSQYDIVVNLQGDAPLTPAWFIEDLGAGGASWDLERYLHEGVETIANDGLSVGGDKSVDGREADEGARGRARAWGFGPQCR